MVILYFPPQTSGLITNKSDCMIPESPISRKWAEKWDWFFVSEWQFNRVLSDMGGMPKLLQNDRWAIYSEDKIEGSMKLLLSVPLSPSDGQFNLRAIEPSKYWYSLMLQKNF